jgi:hypothetical protein
MANPVSTLARSIGTGLLGSGTPISKLKKSGGFGSNPPRAQPIVGVQHITLPRTHTAKPKLRPSIQVR